jgi:hypothetical protein
MKKKTEDWKQIPTDFLNQSMTYNYLLKDYDGFGKQLNTVNLEANGVTNYEDLLDKWSKSSMNWTKAELHKLKTASHIADIMIQTKLNDPFKSQMSNINWQFAKTMHPYYMDGLPHTRGDIIFLTDKIVAFMPEQKLAELLIHEKTHIWQRKHPDEMSGWMERMKFTKVHKTSEDDLQRMNPDVDHHIYKNKNNQICGIRFKHSQPINLHDISGVYEYKNDHPYEQFAYSVVKTVNKENN